MPTRTWHGDYWTQGKLRTIDLYNDYFGEDILTCPFNTLFVDACAGTGFVERCNPRRYRRGGLLTELPPNVSEGSARRALALKVPFDRYVFIEKDRARFADLRTVR